MTGAGKLGRIAEEAARAGFRKETGRNNRVSWCIRCYACKSDFKTATWGPATTSDMMIKDMRRKGWDVGYGKKPVCPCRDRNRNVRPHIVEPGVIAMSHTPPFVTKPSPSLAPPAKAPEALRLPKPPDITMPPAANPVGSPKIARLVFAALEDHLDMERMLYRDGYSDERVAKETGAAVEYVTRIRADAFGELAEDPVISALRDDVELLRLEIGDQWKRLLDKISELAKRLRPVA